ncbi:hypothetical protein ACJIZ3_013267 [Penstemon smallii]|uniref:Dof-type domain-containing protein n=1 Tax=Penstemon smallii TaxID=265156 RepID=A0ABD3UQN4_9LAMI
MGEVQDNNNSSGIKLFGATISVKEKNDQEEPNPTVEKRPDKIIPCPRCKSMETKFCYFNNYNVNQPRHFCKGCHRYWTAGGALRSVPVGAGRRKNKPPRGEVSDGSGVDFNAVVEHGGFGQLFPVKRRRCVSNSQNDPLLCLVVSREKNN